MISRGPDAGGAWQDRDAGLYLGHRRLSIIDIDARSDQPFISSDGRHVIVFNGEIYNYRQLGSALQSDGVRLRTTSDTEVVLELYRRYGPSAFARLRGMFALAIWDADDKVLTAARDPYGIKPLYLANTGNGILFASQVKALQASGVVSGALDNAGVAGFYIWGSVPEPFTLYRDIQAVPAGTSMQFRHGHPPFLQAYADLRTAWAHPAARSANLEQEVRAALNSSISAHLVADVPVAVLLSGGVDSGAIAGLVAQEKQTIEGVTIRFDEFEGGHRDECPRAAAIAETYGLKHTVRSVGRDEFLTDMPRIIAAMDQPSIDGVNTWFAAKAVAERGYKVALSGIGGDELFCGYDTFNTTPRLHRLGRTLHATGPLRHMADPLFSTAARLSRKPKVAAIPTYGATMKGAYMLRRATLMPDELSLVMTPEAARDGLTRLADADDRGEIEGLSEISSVAVLESGRYLRNQLLRDADWASMAHSLELRTPLVDWDLTQALAPFARSFATGVGKKVLGAAPLTPLPSTVLNHRKTGFGLPISEWLEDPAASRNSPTRGMERPWARRWASQIADAFGFGS